MIYMIWYQYISIKCIDTLLGGMKRDPFFIVVECQVVEMENEQWKKNAKYENCTTECMFAIKMSSLFA